MRSGVWLGLLLSASIPAEPVRFVAHGDGYRVEVQERRVCLVDTRGFGDGDRWYHDDSACVELLNASRHARLVNGKAPDAVRVLDVYPGVNLECAGDGRQLRVRLVAQNAEAARSVHLRSTGFGFRKATGDVLQIRMPSGQIQVEMDAPAAGGFRLHRGHARYELTATPSSSDTQLKAPDHR